MKIQGAILETDGEMPNCNFKKNWKARDNMQLKLSIIVPVYNVEQYLGQCVESILNQTYTNLKVILIDDGSTDNSGKICDRLAMQDNRVIVYHQENKGVSTARNKGVELADTEWIGFVDADDELHPNMYKELMALAEEQQIGVVCCSFTTINGDEPVKVEEISCCTKEYEILEGNQMVEWYIKRNEGLALWNKVYRRELFEEVRFPDGKIAEDIFTTYKILHLSQRVIKMDTPYYFYRLRTNSITKQKFSLKRWDNVAAQEQLLKFISDEYPNLKKNAVQRYIGVALSVVNGHIATNYDINDERFDNVFEFLKKNIWIILSMPNLTIKEKIATLPIILGKRIYILWYNRKSL